MSTIVKDDWEAKQAQHYNKIAAQYEAHYSDKYSQIYRRYFLNRPMLAGIDLKGKQMLEAMCGSGQTTDYLLAQGAHVTGLDISAELITSFQKSWPGCEGVCASIFETPFENQSFDVVVIVGGLHHLHPRVNQAIDEIHRILKPGGYFCFMEPHTGSAPDLVRKLWYRYDPLFEKNEAAIDIGELKSHHEARFDFLKTRYVGNIAYLAVLNSLVFRVPMWLKRLYSPLLLGLEWLTQPLMMRFLSCVMVCQWRKR